MLAAASIEIETNKSHIKIDMMNGKKGESELGNLTWLEPKMYYWKSKNRCHFYCLSCIAPARTICKPYGTD